nr:Abi family protein [Lactobacillus rodentium]
MLEERGLLFQDKELAKKNLLSYGYYEIINGYKDCFLDKSSESVDKFKSGITFEHIFQLFTLDRNLRSEVISAIEVFEANLRQAVAYTVAEQISENQEKYLDRRNYVTGKKQYNRSLHKKAYPIDALLAILTGITHANSEPYRHYREEHNNIPPWIIVKKLNFGNLIWWYRLLKAPQKRSVTSRMTGLDKALLQQLNEFESGYSSLLSLYLDFRNTSAHGGRIYNHFSKRHALPYNPIIHDLLKISPADYRVGKGQSHLGTLINTLQFSQDLTAYNELRNGSKFYIERYLKLYPGEKEFIYSQAELSDDLFH